MTDHPHYIASKLHLNYYMQMWPISIFFSRSATNPTYCLVVVDLVTSNNYTYPVKKRNLLSKKLELFYNDIEKKRKQVNPNEKMRLQTDLKFQQNKIKELNKIFDVEMVRSSVKGGKAYPAKQKIREFKNLLFKSKKLHKANSN